MGNCLQTSGGAGGDGVTRRRITGGGEEEDEAGSVLKVKMVLTKAELEWLMAQLKAGDRRLEDVLQEMARKRHDSLPAGGGGGGGGGGDGWRPSLESIVECPETTAASFDC
ncbi:hypothetical protein GUJ93_ZPchr0002g24763 [Zizania palustris]|uniref:Uncharacterized protein n=1 Tax=Zizania palustris TaxID=103762 RepID=A0A8J5RUX6_ZIZPA|nr:hypothetical protein GUJ93_ZPchr0002g24763 [Zizania palustris]